MTQTQTAIARTTRIAVLVGEIGGDEVRIATDHLTGLAHEHHIDVKVVPFATVEELARDAEQGNLDAVYVWRRSDLSPVEAQLGGVSILSFASARPWFAGGAQKPGLTARESRESEEPRAVRLEKPRPKSDESSYAGADPALKGRSK